MQFYLFLLNFQLSLSLKPTTNTAMFIERASCTLQERNKNAETLVNQIFSLKKKNQVTFFY